VTPPLARAMLAQGEHGAVTGQFGNVRLPDAAAQAELSVVVAFRPTWRSGRPTWAKPPSPKR
jgi:hypothetical protein